MIVLRQEIQFCKSVFVPVCRFRSSKKLTANFKQTRIHCAQVQHYLKIPGVMLRRLSISRIPLVRRTAEAGPDSVRLRES